MVIFWVIYLIIRFLVLLSYFFPGPHGPTWQFYDVPFALMEIGIIFVYLRKSKFLDKKPIKIVLLLFLVKSILVTIYILFALWFNFFRLFVMSQTANTILQQPYLNRTLEMLAIFLLISFYNIPLIYLLYRILHTKNIRTK